MKKLPAVPRLTITQDHAEFLFSALDSDASLEMLSSIHRVIDAVLTIKEEIGINVSPFIASEGLRKLTEPEDEPTNPHPPKQRPEGMEPDADPTPKNKSTLTPAGRRALSRKLKARWAEKRKAKAVAEKAKK